MLRRLQRWLFGQADRPAVTEEQWARVEAGLPFLAYLPADARSRLRTLALEFLDQKTFHGAHDLVLTDDILLSIALQACLPIYHTGLDAYRQWVGVVVYAGDFVIPREEMDEDGVVHEYDEPVLGEAWPDGPVVVSWQPQQRTDGLNVVIHEFAHKLDMCNGQADGFPPLPADMRRADWARIFTAAYDDFCHRVDHDLPHAIDAYAAENPAEFFAVMSEAFFEVPLRLRAAYPAAYAQLKRLYGLDPAAGANPHPTHDSNPQEH
ncbi:M90 family metallopeptidase [Denitromonas ohlonensis]|uniref:Zinc-dependent peptidase n=2 Tax=Denitromonas TaxID=139331 RepID=A0A557SPY2_9RHOO|nr:M90 family metallopeptidase [Denitromonas ohlonensis]TVO65837.1 zinc-dependent peptidase [Denitromonas ohlonensis]TVO79430.1 zinc-dependent peptidase [Denitromonas ohlonensis]